MVSTKCNYRILRNNMSLSGILLMDLYRKLRTVWFDNLLCHHIGFKTYLIIYRYITRELEIKIVDWR